MGNHVRNNGMNTSKTFYILKYMFSYKHGYQGGRRVG